MSTQVREPQTGKHDAFISTQLARAEQRIRLIDLATALGGWIAGTLAFAILIILLDRQFVLSAATRQIAFLVYLAAAGSYLAFTVVRPLRWRVNPHFAARQLEQTTTNGRNHVINWIDLHGEKVPGVIRSAIGQRAARDLAGADIDEAISSRRAIFVSVGAGLLLGVFLTLFVLFGPGPFRSLLARAFAPFGNIGGIATRTQVRIARPEAGHAVVTIGSAVTIVAEVTGRIPDAHEKDAPSLLYRHDESEPYRRRFLHRDPTSLHWAATIAPIDVGNGFLYKVTAGDGETPEYRIGVRAAPLIADFVAIYRYRPYTHRADRSRITRKLDDLRGTMVEVLARTNRAVRDGRLDFEGADGAGEFFRAAVHPEDPQALRFRFPLDRNGRYRIRFTSSEGEVYLDPVAHEVVARPDLPPEVRLTKPGKDVDLPLDGQLELVGDAADDIGIARLTLHARVIDGPALQPRPYLPGKLGTAEVGTPRRLEYRDLLEPAALKDEQGKPAGLRVGMQLEYWLEAADACDYPRPNVSASARFKIRLTAPTNDLEKKKQQEQQRQQQKEHEKQQEQQLKNEKTERDRQKEQDAAEEKQKEQQRGENGKEEKRKEEQGEGGKDQKEEKGEKGKEKGDRGEGNQEKNEGKNGAEQAGGDGADRKKEEETRQRAEALKDALEKKEKGEGKPEKDRNEKARAEEQPGEARGDGEKKPGEKNQDSGEKKPGENRDSGEKKPQNGGEKKPDDQGKGNQGGENRPAEKKDGGEGQAESKGQARDAGNPTGADGKAGSKEGGQPGQKPGQPSPGQGKPGEKSPPPRDGEGQRPGDPAAPRTGERTPRSDPKPGEQVRPGQNKDSKTPGRPAQDQRPAEKKDGAGEGTEKKGEGKPGSEQASGSSPAENKPGETAAPKDGKPGASKETPGGKPEGADGSKPGESKGRQGEAKPAPEDNRSLRPDPTPGNPRDQEGRKEGKGPGKAEPGAGKPEKPEDGKGGMGEAKGKEEGKNGEPGPEGPRKNGDGPRKEGDASSGQGKGKGKDNSRADRPGEGLAGDRQGGGGGEDGEAQPVQRERAAPHRPNMLQLEEFRKKVGPDVLRDAKMSREQFERFLRDYAELAKRQPPAVEEPDTPPPAGRSGPLPSMGGKVIQRTPGSKGEELRNEGRAKPPPEYRDAHSDFLRLLRMPSK